MLREKLYVYDIGGGKMGFSSKEEGDSYARSARDDGYRVKYLGTERARVIKHDDSLFHFGDVFTLGGIAVLIYWAAKMWIL